MRIERAYCVELGQVMDIYEARDCYFAQTPPRRRYEFLCSDEQCRAANGTKVTGVNYDKLVEESRQYVRPHFRENTEHITDCEWMELEDAETEVEGEADEEPGGPGEPGRPRRRRDAKSTNVVDIFVPPAAGGRRGGGGRIPVEIRDSVRGIRDRRDRIDALKQYLKNNPNRTSFLENVVDSFLGLDEDERRTTLLKIGDAPRRSYRECFRPIKFYDRRPAEDYIYYGGASARKYGANYSLLFYDRAEVDGRERMVTLYIERARLDRYSHREYLLEFLEGMLEEGHYATVFFYGTFRPGARREEFVDVVIDHFDNLVLRLKEKQRK